MSTPAYDFDSKVLIGISRSLTLTEARGVVTLWRGILTNPGTPISAARSLAVDRTRITYKDIEKSSDPVTLECEMVGAAQAAINLVAYKHVDRMNTALAFLVFLTELRLAPAHDLRAGWEQAGSSGESLYRVQKEEPRILWALDGEPESLISWQE